MLNNVTKKLINRPINELMLVSGLVLFCLGVPSFAAEAPLSPVTVDTVIQMPLMATTDLNGTLHSRSHISITAGVNGRLEWLAEPGTYVEQGEVMVKMDLQPLQLLQAEQQAQIKRATINVTYLKKELARLQQLSKTKATSAYQLDQTHSEYELAQADIDIANVKLQQIEDQLRRATITAPFSGVVTERLVRAGTDVNRSDTLLKLLDTEHLEARLYVPIKYLPYVKKGYELKIVAGQQEVSAAVTATIPSADPRSQTFEIRITIPEHLNNFWAAGQLVKVTVPIQDLSATLTVHRDALILRKEGTYVVKVDSENMVHKLPVIVGQGTKDRVSITGALVNGDKVAIRGAERLNDGQRVVVQ